MHHGKSNIIWGVNILCVFLTQIWAVWFTHPVSACTGQSMVMCRARWLGRPWVQAGGGAVDLSIRLWEGGRRLGWWMDVLPGLDKASSPRPPNHNPSHCISTSTKTLSQIITTTTQYNDSFLCWYPITTTNPRVVCIMMVQEDTCLR